MPSDFEIAQAWAMTAFSVAPIARPRPVDLTDTVADCTNHCH